MIPSRGAAAADPHADAHVDRGLRGSEHGRRLQHERHGTSAGTRVWPAVPAGSRSGAKAADKPPGAHRRRRAGLDSTSHVIGGRDSTCDVDL